MGVRREVRQRGSRRMLRLVTVLSFFALLALVVAIPIARKVPSKPHVTAARLRRWDGSHDCSGGSYTVIDTDRMDFCATLHFPEQAIWFNQTNATAFGAYRVVGSSECILQDDVRAELVAQYTVGKCEYDPSGHSSQMRVWVSS